MNAQRPSPGETTRLHLGAPNGAPAPIIVKNFTDSPATRDRRTFLMTLLLSPILFPAIMLGMDVLKLFARVQIDFANRELRLLLPRGAARRG